MNKSQHWYDKDGNACFEVPKAKGGGMRATTLADARKMGLYPSVTTIMGVMAKPQLDDWKLQQVAERAYANPQRVAYKKHPLPVHVYRSVRDEPLTTPRTSRRRGQARLL